jgi:tellurite resistance protein/uncharacterized protein (DUF697 family)
MTPTDTRAILTLSLLAAYADGAKHDREREAIRQIAEGLSSADAAALSTLYQDVLMKRVTVESTTAALGSGDARQLAYEMAVCVCDADGAQSPAEAAFLAGLRQALKLDAATATEFTAQAAALTTAPLALPAPVTASSQAEAAPAGTASAAPARAVDGAALDADILSAAIQNGALELLPETLSTLAIIPLQMKLVYRIGLAHGYQLDQGHVKDFLATAGVGLTSQYLEQAGRKLLGGLLGRLGGGIARGVGQQAVSSGMSFVATYALGQVAKRYYAGGRTLSAELLKDSYAALSREAQALYSTHLPAIQAQARTLDPGKVLAMVRRS